MDATSPYSERKPLFDGRVKRARSEDVDDTEGPLRKKQAQEHEREDGEMGYVNHGFKSINAPRLKSVVDQKNSLDKHVDHIEGPKTPENIYDSDQTSSVDGCITEDDACDKKSNPDPFIELYDNKLSNARDEERTPRPQSYPALWKLPNAHDDQEPRYGEDILDFCRRVGYVMPRTATPTGDKVQRFLQLKPVRKLDCNPHSLAGPWRPNVAKGNSKANWYALLTQVSGRVALRPCEKCALGRARWSSCVVPPTTETWAAVKGACACCLYNNQGSTCSFPRDARRISKIPPPADVPPSVPTPPAPADSDSGATSPSPTPRAHPASRGSFDYSPDREVSAVSRLNLSPARAASRRLQMAASMAAPGWTEHRRPRDVLSRHTEPDFTPSCPVLPTINSSFHRAPTASDSLWKPYRPSNDRQASFTTSSIQTASPIPPSDYDLHARPSFGRGRPVYNGVDRSATAVRGHRSTSFGQILPGRHNITDHPYPGDNRAISRTAASPSSFRRPSLHDRSAFDSNPYLAPGATRNTSFAAPCPPGSRPPSCHGRSVTGSCPHIQPGSSFGAYSSRPVETTTGEYRGSRHQPEPYDTYERHPEAAARGYEGSYQPAPTARNSIHSHPRGVTREHEGYYRPPSSSRSAFHRHRDELRLEHDHRKRDRRDSFHCDPDELRTEHDHRDRRDAILVSIMSNLEKQARLNAKQSEILAQQCRLLAELQLSDRTSRR